MANRTSMEPKGTDELIDAAYKAEVMGQLRLNPDMVAPSDRCPPNMRGVLRIVDAMVRQRLLEHAEREALGRSGPRRNKGK